MQKLLTRLPGAIGALFLMASPPAFAQMGGGMMGGSSEAPRTDPAPFYNAGMAAFEAHNYQEAIRQLRSAHRADPGNSTFNYSLGLAYAGAGQQQDAQRAYASAARDRNAPAGAWLQLGLVSLQMGDRGKAVEQQRALEDAIGHCDRRCGDGRRAELQGALDQLLQALNAPPTTP